MCPSPSLGAPWLSLSASPAVGPCGIPDELELDEPDEPDELEEPPEPDVVAAGALELEEWDEDELLPQPAAMIASNVSATAAERREVVNVVMSL
jgi:hypothetical protein